MTHSEPSTAELPEYHVEKTHPGKPIVCIADIHADPVAFLTSLEQAGMIACVNKQTLEWTETEKIRSHTIILLGDLFDRGPDNLGVLKSISHLQAQGATIEIAVGNHDAEWLQILRYRAAQRIWGLTLNHLEKFTQENPCSAAKSNIDGVVSENRRLLMEIWETCSTKNAETMYSEVQKLFSETAPLNQLHMGIRHGDMLFIHSDVSSAMMDFLETNREEHVAIPIDDHITETDIDDCLYRRLDDENFLCPNIRKRLFETGIMHIVRGHEISRLHPAWDHRHQHEHIHILNMDAGTSSGLRQNDGVSHWSYAEFGPYEEIKARSSKGVQLL